jgi:hypothetical protein
MTDRPNLHGLLTKGQAELNRQHAELEVTKQGTLRGGSCGLVLEDGTICGKCQRMSLLRSLGVDYPPTDDKQLMFSAGVNNEDIVAELLANSGWAGKILRESECPVTMLLEGGGVVTGRPDIVLCDADSAPVLGLELKLASSAGTVMDVFVALAPKLDHLIQLGFYSANLATPFDLLYANRFECPVTIWDQKKIPAEHGAVMFDKRGKPNKFKCGYSVYETKYENEELYYRHSTQEDWTKSIVTVGGLRRYYQQIVRMQAEQKLTGRPVNLSATGEAGHWDKCDARYCPLSGVCEQYEGDYTQWLDQAKALAGVAK